MERLYIAIDAARVATLMMLQEDFSHPLSKHLALYSCLSYIQNPLPEVWKPPPPPPPEEETEEQVLRIKFLSVLSFTLAIHHCFLNVGHHQA